jgi:hypothetical protein
MTNTLKKQPRADVSVKMTNTLNTPKDAGIGDRQNDEHPDINNLSQGKSVGQNDQHSEKTTQTASERLQKRPRADVSRKMSNTLNQGRVSVRMTNTLRNLNKRPRRGGDQYTEGVPQNAEHPEYT